MSKAPREFWIQTFRETCVLPQNRIAYAYDKEQMDYHAGYADQSRKEFYAEHIHVIEKSAYDALKLELEKIQAGVYPIGKMVLDLKNLRAELEQYRSKYGKIT